MICDNSNAITVFYKISAACAIILHSVIYVCEKLARVFIYAFIKLHIPGKSVLGNQKVQKKVSCCLASQMNISWNNSLNILPYSL